ncbi:MAG: response regulator [Bacillota bacterium]|nr:response regulator [Bacillota bacterium]
MSPKGDPIVILLIEDDEDDYMLTKEALKESRLKNDMVWVRDGQEAMDYLLREGDYQDSSNWPMPELVLLDLNLPKKDGREVLAEIKTNPVIRHIPVVVLTTSKAEEDIIKSYDLGGNSFIQKPVSFDKFVETMKAIGRYWFEVVALPKEKQM